MGINLEFAHYQLDLPAKVTYQQMHLSRRSICDL